MLQCVRSARPGRNELERVLPHPAAALDLVLVERRARSGVGSSRSLVERPAQVDRRRARRDEDVVRRVEVLPALGCEREPVRRGDADRGSAADGERADRLGDLGRRRAPQLDLLVGQPPLVEDDHRVRLEPDDALGG